MRAHACERLAEGPTSVCTVVTVTTRVFLIVWSISRKLLAAERSQWRLAPGTQTRSGLRDS